MKDPKYLQHLEI
jgi:hypothetical protein